MNIQTCRSKEKFNCIYLTKDTNKNEFLEEISPWELQKEHEIKEYERWFEVIFQDMKHIYYYNIWYVNDDDNGFYRPIKPKNFYKDYEITNDINE